MHAPNTRDGATFRTNGHTHGHNFVVTSHFPAQVRLLETDTLGAAGLGRLGRAPGAQRQPDGLSGV